MDQLPMSGADGDEHEERVNGELSPPSYESLDPGTPPPYSARTLGLFDIPEAPPDYFAVVQRIQHARNESQTCCDFVAKALHLIVCSAIILVLFVILMSIPVAMLGVGALYLGQCPIEPQIPVFLIVYGVCGIVKSVETLIKQVLVCTKPACVKTCRKHPRLKYLLLTWRIVDFFFNLVLLGWSIAGSYWIFHVYPDLLELNFDDAFCHPVLYKFSFGMMICIYIVVGLTCCCVCGCALCRNQPQQRRSERNGLRHGLSSVPHAECGEEEETGNEGEREREGSSSRLTSSPSVGGDSLEDIGLQDDFFKYYQQPANLNHSNNRESVL